MLKRFIFPIFIIILPGLGANAQFGSVPMNIRTPYGNTTVWHSTYMPMQFGSGVPFKKYAYTVVLKNDSIFTGKGKMHIKKGIAVLKLKGKDVTKEFYPKETKEVYRVLSDGKKMSGVPSFDDSCWLFRVYVGKINEFAIVPEWGTPFFSAVQQGEGAPVKKLTKENILPMVEDNPKAVKKAKKNKLNTALDIYNSSK